jgi:hypothetical protein
MGLVVSPVLMLLGTGVDVMAVRACVVDVVMYVVEADVVVGMRDVVPVDAVVAAAVVVVAGVRGAVVVTVEVRVVRMGGVCDKGLELDDDDDELLLLLLLLLDEDEEEDELLLDRTGTTSRVILSSAVTSISSQQYADTPRMNVPTDDESFNTPSEYESDNRAS